MAHIPILVNTTGEDLRFGPNSTGHLTTVKADAALRVAVVWKDMPAESIGGGIVPCFPAPQARCLSGPVDQLADKHIIATREVADYIAQYAADPEFAEMRVYVPFNRMTVCVDGAQATAYQGVYVAKQ